jgi:hypothetical protein
MTQITDHHIRNALGVKGAAKAKKRRTGGDANDQGHDFEEAFVARTILEEISATLAADRRGADVHIKAQPLGFIDDLVVTRWGAPTVYSELKSSRAQRCTKALKYNVVRQQQVIVRNGLKGVIQLVLHEEVAGATVVQNDENRVPILIKGFAVNVRIDYKIIWGFLDTFGDRFQLATMRALLAGAWVALGKDATIYEIHKEWRQLVLGEVASVMPEAVHPLFGSFISSFPDVHFSFDRGIVRWRIGPKYQGILPFEVGSEAWQRFQQDLLDAELCDSLDVFNIILEHEDA